MSFAAGIGAGMGAGIGTGIAIGMSSGKKRACEEIREHFHVNGLTVHDHSGKEMDLEEVLARIASGECSSKNVRTVALAISLLLGVLAGGLVLYLVLS